MEDSATGIPLDRLLAHRDWVRRVARALVRDENLADDLEQDVWLAALQRPPRSARSLRGWLAAALRHDLADRRRAEAARAAREASRAPDESIPSAEEVVARADADKRVVVAVMDLSEPYRSTILFRFFEDLPPSVIARRQGVPVATVDTRLRRALALLRERFDAESDGDRRAWCLAIAPLAQWAAGAGRAGVASSSVPTSGTALLGGLLMKMSTKAAIAAAALLLLGGAAWWTLRDGAAPPAATDTAAANPGPAPQLAHPKPRRVREELPAAAPPLAAPAPTAAAESAPAPLHPVLVEEKAPPGEVLGRVLLLRDRSPVEGAVVRLTGGWGTTDTPLKLPSPCRSTTDAKGAFRLTGLPIGRFNFEAAAEGYAPRTFIAEIPADRGASGIEVLLGGTGGAVEGRVVGPAGPEAGVKVELELARAWQKADASGKLELARPSQKTDAWGNYRFDDVPAGFESVHLVDKAGNYTRTATVTVLPGRTSRADFLGESSLFGTVTMDGAPLADAILVVRTGGFVDYASLQARTAKDGSYRLTAIPAGYCHLAVQVTHGGSFVVDVEAATLAPGENRIDVRLGEGDRTAEIAGRAFAKTTGKPASGPALPEIRLFTLVESAPGAWTVGPDAGVAYVHKEGAFRLPGLRAGRYWVRSIHSGITEPEFEVDLRSGEKRTDLEIALPDPPPSEAPKPSVSYLVGTLTDSDGRPMSGAWVYATAATPGRGSSGSPTDGSGRFRIGHLDPGPYRLRIQFSGVDGFTSEVADTTVAAGTNSLDLHLDDAATAVLSGRVFARSSGKSLGYPQVRLGLRLLLADGTDRDVGMALPTSDGRFTIRYVRPSRLRLVADVRAPGLAQRAIELEVAAGARMENLEVALDDAATGTVVLVVKDGEGRPVQEVTIVCGRDGRSERAPIGGISATGVYEIYLEPGAHDVMLQTRDSIDTATVEVRPGETTRAEFTMHRPTGLERGPTDPAAASEQSVSWLVGTVTDASGAPIVGAFVRAHAAEDQDRTRHAATNGRGQFRIEGLRPGTWRLHVQVIGGRNNYFDTELAETAVVAGANTLDLHLGGESTSDVTGRVFVRATGRALSSPDVQVAAFLVVPGAKPRYVGGATAAADGSFTFHSLPLGRLQIVAGPMKADLRKATLDLQIAAGDKPPNVEIALDAMASGKAVFTVKDEDGRPVQSAIIEALRDGEREQGSATMTNRSSGIYETFFEVGTHAVSVSSLDHALVGATTLEIRKGETTAVEVVLHRAK